MGLNWAGLGRGWVAGVWASFLGNAAGWRLRLTVSGSWCTKAHKFYLLHSWECRVWDFRVTVLGLRVWGALGALYGVR